MDIFAHGLWTAAAARGANFKLARKIRVGWAAFWGVFPDLFAFTIPVTMAAWERLTNPAEAAMRAGRHGLPRMHLVSHLYPISHSLIIFSAVFGLVWLIARHPVLELLGWSLHILIDIPTHTSRFYATPFLYPVSSYRFGGLVAWPNPWFMLLNYCALAIVYFLLWRRKARVAAEPRVEVQAR